MVPALNTAVDLKSLHSQSRQASIRHALKALRLCHSVKMITSQVQFQSPNLNFANIKIQPFFAISPNLMPAKFSRYTVCIQKFIQFHLLWLYIQDVNRHTPVSPINSSEQYYLVDVVAFIFKTISCTRLYLVELLPPTLTWWKQFLVASFLNRITGEQYKLITSTATTKAIATASPKLKILAGWIIIGGSPDVSSSS